MATVTTATVSVNPAFFQEIKEVNQELWQLLTRIREFISRPAAMRLARDEFIGMLSRLRDNLAMHFALEEFYGYFEEPVVVFPRLGRLADELRAEHRSLYLEAAAIADWAEKVRCHHKFSRASQRIALRLTSFLDQFEQHEFREDELIIQAYNLDSKPVDWANCGK